MTKAELIADIQEELTFSKALPYVIPEKEIARIIRIAEGYFYDNWRHAVEPRYLAIPQDVFKNDRFKKERAIRLPDCVQFVHQAREPRGASIFGSIDRDFSENKFIGSEIFLTPFIGESIMYRTILFSFLDLTKGFVLDTFAYNYNRNTHDLIIMGRSPIANGMVLEVAKKIELEDLYNDELFQRYVRAKAKLRLGELLTSFDYNLPGGVKVNYLNMVTRADEELKAVLEMMKGENTADWMFLIRQ
jgi:hypothetical protein